MVGIYKITNKLNNKIYIGQSVNIKTRWKDHSSLQKWDREPNSHLYKSMRKYGLENFKFEVLEKCSPSELNKKEEYYIKKFNSNDKNKGYNKTDGGDNHTVGENNPNSKLQEADVYNIRVLRSKLKTRQEVFELYKEKIAWSGFLDIWQGCKWKNVIVEGAYSKKVEDFQKSLRGGRHNSKLSDSEVLKIRERYVKETVKEIFEDYKDIYESLGSFELVVHGRSYSHLPIYKKREKVWINK